MVFVDGVRYDVELTFNCSCKPSISVVALFKSVIASSLSASARDKIVEIVREGEGERALFT